MKYILRRHTISIKHAIDGLKMAFTTQPNYQIHLLLSVLTVIGAIYFQLSRIEWLIVVLIIFVGLVIETINTAIEATTDAIDIKIRDDIKIAKDVSAAAMLIYATGAVIMAGIIFIPKIFF